MIKKLKNKKGTKPLSIYWFVILVIVAGGVAYMAAIFYSAPYDIRGVEANLIENKLLDCLIVNNYLSSEILLEKDFFGKCGINFETEDYGNWDSDQYYVEVKIKNINGDEIPNGSFVKGNLNLKDYCELSEEEPNLPYCLKDSVYAIDQNNGKYQLNFIVVVDKGEKNV